MLSMRRLAGLGSIRALKMPSTRGWSMRNSQGPAIGARRAFGRLSGAVAYCSTCSRAAAVSVGLRTEGITMKPERSNRAASQKHRERVPHRLIGAATLQIEDKLLVLAHRHHWRCCRWHWPSRCAAALIVLRMWCQMDVERRQPADGGAWRRLLHCEAYPDALFATAATAAESPGSAY